MKKQILKAIGIVLTLGFIVIACTPKKRSTQPIEIHPPLPKQLSPQMSGLLNGQFIFIDDLQQKGDSLWGEYLIQKRGVLVKKRPFSLYITDQKKINFFSPDFEGQIDYQGTFEEEDAIHLQLSKHRKILWFIPWGQKTFQLHLTPYKIKRHKILAGRYEKDLFHTFTKNEDVRYGKAEGFWTSFKSDNMDYLKILEKGTRKALRKRELPLQLDIYKPEKDPIKKRPLLLLIHGGGFYIGDKADPTYLALANYYVKKGYVVASMNYRMGFLPSSKAVERAGVRGVQDARAALRFLMANHKTYGFDPDHIFLMGSSAGAITSLNVAFLDEDERPKSSFGSFLHKDLGKLDESGNDLTTPFTIKGIINMWGAVDTTAIMDDDEQVALLHFHGDNDKIVPYSCDFPFANTPGRINRWLMPRMCGSKAIHAMALSKKWDSRLFQFKGKGHMPHLDEDHHFNAYFDTILHQSRIFLLEQLADPGYILEGERAITRKQDSSIYTLGYQKKPRLVNWYIKGGLIKKAHEDRVEVLWYDQAKEHEISCEVSNNIGLVTNLSLKIDVP